MRVGASALNDAASATAVVGPYPCRESAGRIAVSWGPEERSDVCVKTVSASFSISVRPVRISKPRGGPGAFDVTWLELAAHTDDRVTRSSRR